MTAPRVAALILCSALSAHAGGRPGALSLPPGPPASPVALRQPEGEPGEERKSPGLAAAYSLLLPGMGELYTGSYASGKYFTVAEGALWLAWTSFQLYGSWLQTDARSFAVQHAGIAGTEKSDQYYVDIGNFRTVDEYNESVLRFEGIHKTYGRTTVDAWAWDSAERQEQYRQLRVSSDNAFNNSRFVIAAIGVNHLVSAINAARSALSHNASLSEARGIDLRAGVIGGLASPQGIMISFSTSF